MPTIQRTGIVLLAILTMITISTPCHVAAGMSSTNYTISTTETSGGGGSMNSTNYQTHGTIGQPSALMDSTNPPYSDNYDLYPGIWYIFSIITETCPGDDDGDKDVDGADLAAYILDSGGISLNDFTTNFGKAICP